jgi:hypothetical protein
MAKKKTPAQLAAEAAEAAEAARIEAERIAEIARIAAAKKAEEDAALRAKLRGEEIERLKIEGPDILEYRLHRDAELENERGDSGEFITSRF